MDIIKVEPGSVEGTCESEYDLADAKHEELFETITFPVVKIEDTQEDPCDDTTIEEVVKKEIKAEEHKICLDRSYGKEITLAVATSKEEVKGEISREEHEMCPDSIEDLLIKEECDTASSAVDVAEYMEGGWDCHGTDPLLSEPIFGSSLNLHKYACNEENKDHKVEIHNKQSQCHTSSKAFRCDICKTHFLQRLLLVAHLRTHSGEKPFKCEVCNKHFTRSDNLKTHSRIHTGEKPFKCQVCSKCFKVRSALCAHSRIHTGEKPFKCEVCNKRFTDSSALWPHSRIHTGEKPFKCKVCNKRFTRSFNLKTHFRIHTKDKPFTYEVCN